MSETLHEVEGSLGSHPIYWTVGALAIAGLVAYYYLSGSKSGSNGAAPAYNFSYSVGPTAAQVAAGTAQQNQVQADQTAVSLANIAATSSDTQAGDYFSYLATNSANALATTTNTNATAAQIAGAEINENYQATATNDAEQAQIAGATINEQYQQAALGS
jgi:hypothetical protein